MYGQYSRAGNDGARTVSFFSTQVDVADNSAKIALNDNDIEENSAQIAINTANITKNAFDIDNHYHVPQGK